MIRRALLHEFAHVCCHLRDGTRLIIDDLEVSSSEEIEAEADQFARDALVPPKIWANCALADLSTAEIEKAARQAGVHPAIVAGRWRWKMGTTDVSRNFLDTARYVGISYRLWVSSAPSVMAPSEEALQRAYGHNVTTTRRVRCPESRFDALSIRLDPEPQPMRLPSNPRARPSKLWHAPPARLRALRTWCRNGRSLAMRPSQI